MEQSWRVRVIERKEVREDDSIEYFLLSGSEVPFGVLEGIMAVEAPQNERDF